MENENADEWLKNLPVQTENPAFKPEEMVLCAKCQRTNPPTRLACFYCGAELELDDAQSKNLRPHLRKMEAWEKGFNLILSPGAEALDETKISETAKILNLEREVLLKLLESDKALPLARAESEKEAEILWERLLELGLKTFVLRDDSLTVEKPPKRLRGLKFSDDKISLMLFNRDEVAEIALEDLRLIVKGAIFERKVESTEKRVKKGESKVLQSTETASDEFLIDIYSRKDATGYRIFAKGFDFSCLGAEKEMLANENLRKLAQKLYEVAPQAKLVEDYLKVRENLGIVWEVEERTDSQGIKSGSFGRYNLANITTVNNAAQFTKYSRLQWHLL